MFVTVNEHEHKKLHCCAFIPLDSFHVWTEMVIFVNTRQSTDIDKNNSVIALVPYHESSSHV